MNRHRSRSAAPSRRGKTDRPGCSGRRVQARIEGHEAERLGLRRLDDLPDVDVHLVAHQRDFVDQSDVDCAKRVFEQLDHFRNARGADRHDRGHDLGYSATAASVLIGPYPRRFSGCCASEMSRCLDRPVLARTRDRNHPLPESSRLEERQRDLLGRPG